MKKYLKTEYKAVLIGIFAYFIFYAANELFSYALIQNVVVDINSSDGSMEWHPLLIVSDILSTLLLITPGFLTGWFSKDKSIVNAIVVIIICYIICFFSFSVSLKYLFSDTYYFIVLFQYLITPVAVGAVSGAAGQFLRNKKGGL